MTTPESCIPAISFDLDPDEAHIWVASLSAPGPPGRLIDILSPHEQARAARFHFFDIHRQRFSAARGLLRSLPGNYLKLEPTAIRFSYSVLGKPGLEPLPAIGLEFNLAHSQDAVITLFTLRRRAGIDLEQIALMLDGEQPARIFFSARESRLLQSQPDPAKTATFSNCGLAKKPIRKRSAKASPAAWMKPKWISLRVAHASCPCLIGAKKHPYGSWNYSPRGPGSRPPWRLNQARLG